MSFEKYINVNIISEREEVFQFSVNIKIRKLTIYMLINSVLFTGSHEVKIKGKDFFLFYFFNK